MLAPTELLQWKMSNCQKELQKRKHGFDCYFGGVEVRSVGLCMSTILPCTISNDTVLHNDRVIYESYSIHFGRRRQNNWKKRYISRCCKDPNNMLVSLQSSSWIMKDSEGVIIQITRQTGLLCCQTLHGSSHFCELVYLEDMQAFRSCLCAAKAWGTIDSEIKSRQS